MNMICKTSRRMFLQSAPVAIALPALGGRSFVKAEDWSGSQSLRDDESLIELILETPRERCVPTLAEEVRRGLSYRQFLSGLFHAAVRFQSTHEIAMMFSAHRISGVLPVKDNLLPLFWALDSLTRMIDKYRATSPLFKKPRPEGPWPPALTGPFPTPAKAMSVFHGAMEAKDHETAERAAVSLSRSIGSRQTMELVWRYGCRDTDNLGHKVIRSANAWRTLDAIGWENAEIPLRHIVEKAAHDVEPNYDLSRQRVESVYPHLPPDWASQDADPKATLELLEEIRAARTAAAVDLVCRQLTQDKVSVGSMWDAIHLAAAELLYRHRTRADIGGWPVHAVTTTNALHFAFRTAMDSQTRLLLVLQAVTRVSEQMTKISLQRGRLRDIRITELESGKIPSSLQDTVADIFSLLSGPAEDKAAHLLNRPREDAACRKAFALLQTPDNRSAFMRSACEYINRKATPNAHDFKFPAAAFEDVGFISERWRPHFLAATVHALHGSASEDAPVFAHAREELSLSKS